MLNFFNKCGYIQTKRKATATMKNKRQLHQWSDCVIGHDFQTYSNFHYFSGIIGVKEEDMLKYLNGHYRHVNLKCWSMLCFKKHK